MLDRGQTKHDVTDKVTNRLSDRVSHRPDGRQPARGLEDLIANLAAFCAVAVERMLVALSPDDQGQLPGQIERILHSRVHALPAGRAVHVRRITREEGSAPTIARDFAAVDPETGEPDR